MKKEKYDIVVIDPVSPEFNRGSFCYLPYIMCNDLKSLGVDFCFFENFSVADMDSLPEANYYFVALWSYPQIEQCLVLNRFLPEKGNVKFFGYNPLIEKYNLPIHVMGSDEIRRGMKAYPDTYEDYKYLLLSDCDMHLRKYEGTVVPLFTSYGCPNGCEFCPTTVNCDKKRTVLYYQEVCEMLNKCNEKGYTNIHFTDEDFFFNPRRAFQILKFISMLSNNFQLIALGSVNNVLRFVKEYGTDVLVRSGMKIIEVGFETGDDELSNSMGKPSISRYEELASIFDKIEEVDIFWLTLTFFPGETITTLNKTGEFLSKHGLKLNEVYGRISTNGTEGGLGQFFQLYHGTKKYDDLLKGGISLTPRPVRLIPSFIPFSFLNSIIQKENKLLELDKWVGLYNIPEHVILFIIRNMKVGRKINYFSKKAPREDKISVLLALAIMARLRIIE